MTISEAIKHCEKVAEEQDKLCKRYDDASGYSRSHNEAIRTTDAKRCGECAKEHRQLAEWLKELQKYREAWEKVKEQIKEEAYWANSDFEEYKTDILGVDIADVPGDDFRYGLERAIEIINKELQEVNL